MVQGEAAHHVYAWLGLGVMACVLHRHCGISGTAVSGSALRVNLAHCLPACGLLRDSGRMSAVWRTPAMSASRDRSPSLATWAQGAVLHSCHPGACSSLGALDVGEFGEIRGVVLDSVGSWRYWHFDPGHLASRAGDDDARGSDGS